MKRFLFVRAGGVAALVFSAVRALAGTTSWPAQMPVYDHIVIVMEENKDYGEVIGSKAAPYISDTLCAEGANMTQMFGEEHFSEGNYFWLFSGGNQSVGFNDVIPSEKKNPNYPFRTPNLAEQLITKGLSFKGYSEGLPSIGNPVARKGLYVRKHVPWVSFANIPDGTNADNSSHLRFADFPADFSRLPTVAFVVPNLIDDMHNGRPPKSVAAGDTWLKQHLDAYYQWAKTHNSLLIVTFDENDDDLARFTGATDPTSKKGVVQNRIPTVIAGAHIKHGDYAEGKGVTHVNLLRTIEAMYGLGACGAQQPNALKAGIADDTIITDIFEKVP